MTGTAKLITAILLTSGFGFAFWLANLAAPVMLNVENEYVVVMAALGTSLPVLATLISLMMVTSD